ncbi:MAG TPA: hypothetical protein DIC64_00395 [Alphaproteobacteria bacterium]|nr:hypothetical protein [Alphaproteobacteria bacterium]
MENIDWQISGGILTVFFKGDYSKKDLPLPLFEALQTNQVQEIKIETKDLKSWDSSFLIILLKLHQYTTDKKIKLSVPKLPLGAGELLNLSTAVPPLKEVAAHQKNNFFDALGGFGLNVFRTFIKGASFALSNLKTYFLAPVSRPVSRPVDFLFALQDCGPKALPIVLLISFMVGLILAFVGAIQLQTFGAQVYVASLVTIGMTRIMGAIMVGIIMAGRTGASFAATIGTMQVNEEIDALKTMGVKTEEFLIFPRLRALVISMPLLTMFADFAGILGGAAVGILALDIPSSEYFRYAYNAWHLKHFLVGLFHAYVFGFIIALSGCYFGVNCGRNADSVGLSTTKAVVYGIVWMIVATGLITFCLQRMGI